MDILLQEFSFLVNSAIKSVLPKTIFQEKIKIHNSLLKIENIQINLDEYKNIYVIGFGKASSAMASELEKFLGDRITNGIIITKYGFKTLTKKIKVYEAGHPLPDKNTLLYSNNILKMLKQTSAQDLIICLISGGGSSLFEVPVNGLDLETLQLINQILITERLSIHQINYYRKALSKVKGGKLLNYIYPSTCLSLIISDVTYDDLSVIASGPTYIESDNSYLKIKNSSRLKELIKESDALEKINKLIVRKKFNQRILKFYPKKVQNCIIASNKSAINEIVRLSQKFDFDIQKIYFDFTGPLEAISEIFRNEMEKMNNFNSPFKELLLIGGETYLEVKGKGKGGRNSHLVLYILNELISENFEPNFNFFIASFATDGNDGPTDSAGAFISNSILKKMRASGIDLKPYLNNFDSYNFFNKFNCLIKTGPTYTNVMDIMIGIFEKS